MVLSPLGTTRFCAFIMSKLFDFILAKKHWLLLFLLMSLSLGMLMHDGLYRQSLSLYVRTWLSGYSNEAVSVAYSYIDLQRKTEELLVERARLEQELSTMRRRMSDAIASGQMPAQPLSDSLRAPSDSLAHEGFVLARVINVHQDSGDSYYVINKGQRDGLQRDMPVMSASGVMGTVMSTSNNYAVVIPITNPKMRLSCMVRGKEYKGQISAVGYNRPIYFSGVSLQAEIAKGDTIVTSGYSYIFPEGLMVGVVEEKDAKGALGASAAFGSFRVKPATNFDRISHVYVLLHQPMTEAQELEQSILPSDE